MKVCGDGFGDCEKLIESLNSFATPSRINQSAWCKVCNDEYVIASSGKSIHSNMAEASDGRTVIEAESKAPDDSSDSENETEHAKSFHRRISTNREIRTTVSGENPT